MDNKRSNVIIARRNIGKGNSELHPRPNGLPKPTGRLSAKSATDFAQDEQARVQRLRLSLQRELELARQMRSEAEKYQRETETKARSEAQRLILDTRLSIKKEISRLGSEAGEQIKQIKKNLIDIRIICLAAQKELEAQRQFTKAAKINALSHAFQDETKQASEERAIKT